VEKLAGRRWLPGYSTTAVAAPLSAGGVEQRKQVGRLEEGDKDRFAISINSRD